MIHSDIQRLCAWSGIVAVVLFFAAFFIALFIPPPGPYLTQAEVVAMYQQNATGIRIGMVSMMASTMFVSPVVAVIAIQMKRMEGATPILAYTQMSTGTVGIVTLLVPPILFLVTAFRPDRSPELTYLMNDMCWFFTAIAWPPFVMQYIVVAIAIFRDKSAQPVFPRWVAFYNVWQALLFLPGGCLLAFFKSGPFAWNGIFTFWIPGGLFASWFIVMLVALLPAIKRQEQEVAGKAA